MPAPAPLPERAAEPLPPRESGPASPVRTVGAYDRAAGSAKTVSSETVPLRLRPAAAITASRNAAALA